LSSCFSRWLEVKITQNYFKNSAIIAERFHQKDKRRTGKFDRRKNGSVQRLLFMG